MLKSLDPHSTYLNPDVYQQVRVQTEGEYGGLGIEVQMENGVVKVVSPIDDTPAANAGIQGGDFITHINGEAIMGKTLTEAVKEMRGPVGSDISITVVREDRAEPFEMSITREKILVRSVRHRVEDETIGYIRVTTFNMQSGAGVENAISELVNELGDNLDGGDSGFAQQSGRPPGRSDSHFRRIPRPRRDCFHPWTHPQQQQSLVRNKR